MFGASVSAHAQGDVRARFLDQAFANVAGGDEFAFLAGERAVVDANCILIVGGSIGMNGSAAALRPVGDGFADEDVFEAGDADDVARVRFLDFDALAALRSDR